MPRSCLRPLMAGLALLAAACALRPTGDGTQDDAGAETGPDTSVGGGGPSSPSGDGPGTTPGDPSGTTEVDPGGTTHGAPGETTHTPPEPSTSGDAADTGDADTTGEPRVFECQITLCSGKVYECGDCLDNDGDGLVDAADPGCWGACDNNETGWKANIPGSGGPPCVRVDCYFDQDKGSGNDDCHWSLTCDPLEPLWCTHDPDATIPGTPMSCEEAATTQSPQCEAFCGPVVPNGCDCFGCCAVTVNDETHTVYLGSVDEFWTGTCGPETIDDPTLCHPCTQTPACLNPCEPDDCQICLGQTTLPEGCAEPLCPEGVQPCLPEHQSGDCPEGTACITGCCIPFLP